MAFGTDWKEIGIRPGEKLHEEMCSDELIGLTLDFGDYFVIKPTVKLVHDYDYSCGGIGVPAKTEYNSLLNRTLAVEEIERIIKEA